jgi:hypothetical protein
MKKTVHALAALFSGSVAFLLSGCLETDEKLVINPDGSGKAQVKIQVAGGGVSFNDETPEPEQVARDTAVGLIGGAQGVEVWSKVKYRVNDEGMAEFTGVAHFPDITKFSVGSMKSGGMSMDGSNSAWKMEESGGLITLTLEPMTGNDEEMEAPTPPEDIEAEIKKQRMEFRQAKPMMSGILAGMKTSVALKVAGEIKQTEVFRKQSSDVATVAFNGKQMLDGMEKVIMDDAMMRKLAATGGMDSQSGDMPPEVMEAAFGGEAFTVTFAPGEPLFDYAAEVAKAKAGQTPELKALIKEAELAGESVEMETSFGTESAGDESAGEPDPGFAAAVEKHAAGLAPKLETKDGRSVVAKVEDTKNLENDGKEGSYEMSVSFSSEGKSEKAEITVFMRKDGRGWEGSGFSGGALPDFLGEGLDRVNLLGDWVRQD